MRLVVTTPLSVLLDVDGVQHVRAEDATGAFGIQPGHADFVTTLAISVVSWRNADGKEHQIAARGGIMRIRDGELVEIATRQAIGEDTLAELGPAVLERLRQEEETEKEAWVSAKRLQIAAIRYVQRYLEAGRRRAPRGPLGGPGSGSGSFMSDA